MSNLNDKELQKMKTLSKIMTIGGLLALAITVSPAISTEAHAYACKGTKYSGAATKNRKFRAKMGARKSWQQAMKSQFGLSWSVINIAKNKSMSCHKTGSKHTCLFLARPCNYVVQ